LTKSKRETRTVSTWPTWPETRTADDHGLHHGRSLAAMFLVTADQIISVTIKFILGIKEQ